MKILIVEDEQKTAALLKELIETHPNYSVMSICDSVETAVNYLQIHQSHLDIVFILCFAKNIFRKKESEL